ncbi:Conserved_hypothetical protein [Hexamita inflata]|uniref:Uncharacterized protein n=1 Tax=Hexamita inflata TaxID=28002 RepID=A0AA86UYV3_9EUKA|nr:Conserved hypothetical protein [Hexamita inflata]
MLPQDIYDIAKQKYLKSLNTTKPPQDEELCRNMTVVMLQNSKITDVPDLSIFQTAQKVYLQNNLISSVAVQQHNTVEDLDLSHNQLSTIPQIGGNNTLTFNLSHNLLNNCSLSNYLPNLCLLNISNQPGDVFADDFGLNLATNAPRLEILICDQINCADLSFVKECKSLRQLSCKQNMIDQIEDVVQYLPQTVVSLNLAGNNVVKKRGFLEMVCSVCRGMLVLNDKKLSAQQVEFAILKASRM